MTCMQTKELTKDSKLVVLCLPRSSVEDQPTVLYIRENRKTIILHLITDLDYPEISR